MIQRTESWAQQRRLDFIDDALTEKGWFNRGEATAYFGVTFAIIAQDLEAMTMIDENLIYNTSTRRYERTKGGSVRGSTPARRKAWKVFKT